jgi:penicillin-binding protein 1A
MSHITKFTRITLWLTLAAVAGSILILASAYLYLSPKLPAVEALRDVQLQTPLRVYTADYQLIGEFGEQRRTPIVFDQIPPDFINALLSIEDDGFYDHHGVSIKGLLRAAIELATTGSIQTGGSTITMQVAKNYFLSSERVFSRKFNEILLALQIEQELSKQEILELYVNKIFLGNRAYGFEAAAQVYYGKSLSELSLAQWAMLAGLPKAPSTYNPLVNPARALERRNYILSRMNELNFISDDDYSIAVNDLVTAEFHGSKLDLDAPFIAEMARKELLNKYGNEIYTAGYIAYTTVDSKLQHSAQQAVINGLMSYDERHGYRGPEQQLTTQSEDEETPQIDDSFEQEQLKREHWLNILKNQKTYNGLIPAIVANITDNNFTAILNDNEEVIVEWETGIKSTRPFITIHQRGASPKQVSDVVSTGDLIRLKQNTDGSWKISQIPNAQAALVSLDASNGAILSLTGGFDYQLSKFNRITQATRQPGSNFKPIVYTAALANGFTAASIINDAPIVFDDAGLESTWRPTNDGGKFKGPTRLRSALYTSTNLVSIRLLRELGIRKAIDYVSRFGFDSSQLPKDLSLALGSHSVTPLQIVGAYSAFANGGFKVNPYLIESVELVDGEILYQANPDTVCIHCEESPDETKIEDLNNEIEEMATIEDIFDQSEDDAPGQRPQAERIIEPRVAYIMDSILRDVIKKGTGRRALSLNRSDLGGKTGTTNGPTDVWFSGYGGGIVTTTWLGFDNNSELGNREYATSAALPIWIEYMQTALKDRPEIPYKQPEGLVTVKIDPTTGLLAKPGQKNAIFEIFRDELAPTEEADSNFIGIENINDDTILEQDIF